MSEDPAPYDHDSDEEQQRDLSDPKVLEERFYEAVRGTDRMDTLEYIHVPTLRNAIASARAAGFDEHHQLMYACLALHKHVHQLEARIHQLQSRSMTGPAGEFPIDPPSSSDSTDYDEGRKSQN